MTLQEIIDHLVAVAADMNASSEHHLAFKVQAAIVAVDACQAACMEFGSLDAQEVGDWPLSFQEA